VLYTAIGSALWNATLTVLGWYLHKLVPLSQLNEQVKIYERPILVGLVILVLVVILYFVYQGVVRRRKQSQRVD
jgi:membrane protein DedA with SNARE-associated domain